MARRAPFAPLEEAPLGGRHCVWLVCLAFDD